MTDEFYVLKDLVEVAGLGIPRAQNLERAILRHRDFTLIQKLARVAGESVTAECLVCDVECDGIPNRNTVGIQYRERLALFVVADETQLVAVCALRKGFPIVVHQHQRRKGSPAALCLYFEPPAEVRRTWTPESFLRRIQFWLEKTARGELHPVDQPIDHLFFESKYELVLPFDFNPTQIAGHEYAVDKSADRADGGITFRIVPAQSHNRIRPLFLRLPPIVHGQVEPDPANLGELVELLAAREVDFLPMLFDAIQSLVGEEGLADTPDSLPTIFVLDIPVIRELGGAPEARSTRAFLFSSTLLKLGAAIGALFTLDDNLYYRNVNVGGENFPNIDGASWRDEPLFPMDVLKSNDAREFRRQSGVSKLGPRGVLIGAGSLGSMLIQFWVRSGWGTWSVIDKDHIKPHNLARHTAENSDIGLPKSDVLAAQAARVTQGAVDVTAVYENACNLKLDAVKAPLAGAELVIDASTTLEYPRLASIRDDLPRHISLFVTPDGNAAVLLAEDKDRSIRLRSLEAQYYRAVISSTWGEDHLRGNMGSFWSGASCRDISVILPYSRIAMHACTLSEQVALASDHDDAAIRVWSRDPELGTIEVHSISASPEQRFELDELALFIDKRLINKLRTMRAEAGTIETGGVLLGYYDFNVSSVVVVDALAAPPDSFASQTAFERGVAGLADAVQEATKRTAGVVGYLGEWHSHPPGSSAQPSRDDYYQLAYVTLGMAEDGLPAISLIVGEGDIQVLKGRVGW